MPSCGQCEHFDRRTAAKLWHTCELEDPRKLHDDAAPACDDFIKRGPQQSLMIDFRARGAFRQVLE